jgi:beta-N-acetylhexosaminidase
LAVLTICVAFVGCGAAGKGTPSSSSSLASPSSALDSRVATTSGHGEQRRTARRVTRRSLGDAAISAQLGQMIITPFAGTTPSTRLLTRIRRGEVGGVILFAGNVAGGRAATTALTAQLQAAAHDGGQPPLLIATDQEGGEVKRLTWAPPARAPSEMASPEVATAEGEATGSALRSAGVNLDLAPVADVKHLANSFLGTRTFGEDPETVASLACGFAQGLATSNVAYTLKHFPGLGRATGNTDLGPVVVEVEAEALREDYEPYVACASAPLALVMVNNAIFPSLASGRVPAVLAPQTYSTELKIAGAGETPTISDDLEAGALRGLSSVAVRAASAGLDLLLYAGTEAASEAGYEELLAAVRAGTVKASRVERALARIATLKRLLASSAGGQAARG